MDEQDQKTPRAERGAAGGAGKKAYQRPELSYFGRIAEMTLGPSAGTGESGNPLIFMGAVVEPPMKMM